MSRTPNPEQLQAIMMDKGLLLQAGAGSGKTFVIVEHVILKISNWIGDFKKAQRPMDEFSKYIKHELGSIVLMTFTNLAAGEMSIRLDARIKEMVLEDENSEYWKEILQLSHSITNTTIHGFCYKLIRQGFFKDINIDSKLINEDILRLFVSENLAEWLVKTIESKSMKRSLLDKVLLQRQVLIDGLVSIVKDAQVLRLWDNPESIKEVNIWESLCLFNSHPDCFGKQHLDEEFLKTKWGAFLDEFGNKFSKPPQTEKEFKAVFDFFNSIDFKIATARFGKTVPEELKEIYLGIKSLKDFYKKYADDFCSFWNDKNLWQEWNGVFATIVNFIIDKYQKNNLMTFTDMEYLVWKSLDDPETRSRIGERYNYLIVDEFQDTSQMQFDIISSVIQNDFSKLFLVGDLKQAIYGFRGGEISVFKDCAQKMPHVHALKTNYRSDTSIIDFNNRFFMDLFVKNFKDDKVQHDGVLAEDQESGNANKAGKVVLIQAKIPEILKEEVETLSNSDVEKIEASLIRKYIQSELSLGKQNIAVLYRKLGPSKYLIDELAHSKIGFSAQVKIPLSDDPIIAIFKLLIEGLLDVGSKYFMYSNLVISSLLEKLQIEYNSDHLDHIQTFYNNTSYYGLKSAFAMFLQNIHISIPSYKESISIIDQIVEHNAGDIEAVYVSLEQMLQKSYSLNLKFGNDSENITIMTTHASKGLQFGKVIVAGIYTNDHSRANTDIVGKIPMSFQWNKSEISKQKFKTPYFIWENENTKRREFHESKRLLYVACTRAENELAFVDLDFQEVKTKVSYPRSWANLLRGWNSFDSFEFQKMEINEKVDFAIHPNIELPLFHTNDLGIVEKQGDKNFAMIIPELSATRLISVNDCPKKFYFQNICKFDENNPLFEMLDDIEIEEIQGPISSKKRGTRIHQEISTFIDAGFDMKSTGDNAQMFLWLSEQLGKFQNQSIFQSEKLIKFSMFGHMMTAIPDLFILNKEDNMPLEIWDFKTGNHEKQKDEGYFLQLRVYTLALASLYGLGDDYQIKNVICYVDNLELVEQQVQIKENRSELFSLWEKIRRPWVESNEHCKSCGYKSICQI